MKIILNGQSHDFDGSTVAQLIAALGLAGRPAAVEVNKKLVPKAQHDRAALNEGDQVEVVTLVGGG